MTITRVTATPEDAAKLPPIFLHNQTTRGRKTFKYALTVVDVAFRYREVEPLISEEAKEVAERIYKRNLL